jgi:hypothetical protein
VYSVSDYPQSSIVINSWPSVISPRLQPVITASLANTSAKQGTISELNKYILCESGRNYITILLIRRTHCATFTKGVSLLLLALNACAQAMCCVVFIRWRANSDRNHRRLPLLEHFRSKFFHQSSTAQSYAQEVRPGESAHRHIPTTSVHYPPHA